MAVNYLTPQTVWDVITNRPSEEAKDKKLLIHDSRWIDFDRFSAALEVAPNRLRKGFLDQLGFPPHVISITKGIRCCQECLARGYHCSFFSLLLIAKCPWHGCNLTRACEICEKTVVSKGYTRGIETPKEQEPSAASASLEANFVYKSECGDMLFMPDMPLKLSILSQEEQSGINFACNRLLQWWYTINHSEHPRAGFARRLFSEELNEEEARKCLAIAHEVAGDCPWPLRLTPSPITHCQWQQRDDAQEEGREYYATIYKSVRRHIYRRYLRKHRACLAHLMNLTNYQEQYLVASTVCTLALAYISWRMHMERFSMLSRLKEESGSVFYIDSEFRLKAGQQVMTRNPKSMAHLWLIEFFVILGGIERHIDIKSFDIHGWEFSRLDRLNSTVHEFIPHGDPSNPYVTGMWSVLYPKVEFLVKKGEFRCECKLDRAALQPEMYKVGSLSLCNYRPRKHIQFRVLHLAEQRRDFQNSYAYEENHYS